MLQAMAFIFQATALILEAGAFFLWVRAFFLEAGAFFLQSAMPSKAAFLGASRASTKAASCPLG
jgi:hypothetical protein